MSLSLEPEEAFTGPLAAAVAARRSSLTLTPPQCWTAVMGAKLQRACFTAASSSLLEKTGRLMVGGPGRRVFTHRVFSVELRLGRNSPSDPEFVVWKQCA